MAIASDLHYRAYKPAPFAKSEVDKVEVLFGGLHWRAEALIAAVLQNLGYKARALPVATKDDLFAGKELADIGQCCPTSFTTGNLANFLKGEVEKSGTEAVRDGYVYVTAGACGACRFGQYHQSYELALKNIGLDAFRMFLLDQENPDQGAAEGGGFEVNMPMTLGVVWAILVADVIQSIEYRTRPYEVEKGATDRAVKESVAYLEEVFRNRPKRGRKWGNLAWHFSTNYFVNALKECFKKFEAIEVDRLQPKPVVKITGEFYLQTVEGDPNYNIHSWLESEGAEVIPAPVAVWLDYLIRFQIQGLEDYVGIDKAAKRKVAALKGVQKVYRWNYNRLRKALGDIPHDMPDQWELRRLAAPYFHHQLSGGEGDMLIGKAIYYHTNRKAHMICELSPYGCMPNTMSIGAMAGAIGQHPDLLYAPIEVKGDAEIHALSRCQMILTEAKKRAIREYVQAMEVSGLDPETAKPLLDKRPDIARAGFAMPHHGAAGMAANTLLHLAGKSIETPAKAAEKEQAAA
jgi:predicted nucleotide-binding protein (sugar kinase/HSP70/actin superfamily)